MDKPKRKRPPGRDRRRGRKRPGRKRKPDLRDRTGRKRKPRPGRPGKPFVAFRIEASGVDELGRDVPVRLIAASADGETWELERAGAPLETREMLDFIVRRSVGRLPVGYHFGYAAALILRDLAPADLGAFAGREERAYLTQDGRTVYRPVPWQNFRLDGIPGKSLEVVQFLPRPPIRRDDGTFRFPVERRSARLSDVAGFFATSLADALLAYDIQASEPCVGIARLAGAMRTLCRELGYPLRSYFGGGSIAGSMLLAHGVKPHLAPVPPEMDDAVSRAFFGGRFETASLGEFAGVHCYDLHAAYPAELAKLPSLLGGTWERVDRYDPAAEIALWEIRWETFTPGWAPLPFRGPFGVGWPVTGWGWVWAPEVRAAIEVWGHTGREGITVRSGWVFHPAPDAVRPFDFLEPLYATRLAYQRAGDPRELPLKLGMNALWGKLAQTSGAHPYYHLAYAGLVTSCVRAKLYRAIAQRPNDVLSVATDSIVARAPLELAFGDGMGEWAAEEIADLFLAGDGIMFSLGSPQRDRRRGFVAGELVHERILAAWRRDGMNARVVVRTRRFCGIAVGVLGEGNRMARCGAWLELETELGAGSRKRIWLDNEYWRRRAIHTTAPRPSPPDLLSAPYDAELSPQALEERAFVADAPDGAGLYELVTV